jgi:homoserine kinase
MCTPPWPALLLFTSQGLPLGSGMGSSAASAAAAAWAVNGLFGAPLSKAQLIPAGLASEATVSGYHADNIGPALMGGFVLIRWVCRALGGVWGRMAAAEWG